MSPIEWTDKNKIYIIGIFWNKSFSTYFLLPTTD